MRSFVSQTGVKISVGENADENDELTFEVARSDEHWFHVSQFAGAHVVAHADVLDRETKRDAAVLACHFSKAPLRTMKMAVVDHCVVGDVSKPKKSPPGEVVLYGQTVNTLNVFYNRVTEKARLGRLLTGLSTREYMLTS